MSEVNIAVHINSATRQLLACGKTLVSSFREPYIKGAAMKYKMLNIGEKIHKGDQFYSKGKGWAATAYPGRIVGSIETRTSSFGELIKYRRPVKAESRKPKTNSRYATAIANDIIRRYKRHVDPSLRCIDYLREAVIASIAKRNCA